AGTGKVVPVRKGRRSNADRTASNSNEGSGTERPPVLQPLPVIDENFLLECWRDIRKHAACGAWDGDERSAVRGKPDEQHRESGRAAEEEDLPGATGPTPPLDSQTGWTTASVGVFRWSKTSCCS